MLMNDNTFIILLQDNGNKFINIFTGVYILLAWKMQRIQT